MGLLPRRAYLQLHHAALLDLPRREGQQRHEDGEPLLEPSDDEIASASESFRAWRIRLYERPARVKMVDIAFRLAVLGVLVLIFRARIGGNGYFWLLCAELAFRALLMIKRPARFASPTVIEPA